MRKPIGLSVPYRKVDEDDDDIQDYKKPWRGLTELEIAGFVKAMERGNFLVAIYDIEKKLKDKNT
jgi:hypothetical protein